MTIQMNVLPLPCLRLAIPEQGASVRCANALLRHFANCKTTRYSNTSLSGMASIPWKAYLVDGTSSCWDGLLWRNSYTEPISMVAEMSVRFPERIPCERVFPKRVFPLSGSYWMLKSLLFAAVIHFAFNPNCEPVTFVANFATTDPGIQTTYGSLTSVPNNILHAATGIPEANWATLKKQYPLVTTPGTGDQACMAKCGLNFLQVRLPPSFTNCQRLLLSFCTDPAAMRRSILCVLRCVVHIIQFHCQHL